jgi:tetratricopeptide (TPR) repeat protein
MDNEDAITWNNRGISLHSQKLFHEALDAYNRAIALNPDEQIFRVNKEKVLYDIQKFKPNLSPQLSDLPSNELVEETAITWKENGDSLSGEGLRNEALSADEQAIELNPINPVFWKNKVKTLEILKQEREKNYASDLSELFEPVQHDVNYQEAISWNNRGYGLAETGDHQGALAAYNQALHLNPNFSEAWNNKGYSLMELGNIEEAIDCIHQAIKINPDLAKPWIRKFILLTYLLRNDEALEAIFKISNQN